MSKVTKKIEDTLTEWETNGVPQWKKDQLVRDCLIKFKDTQWENSVVAQNLTSLDKKEWDAAFDARFPMHAPAVVEYDRKFELGRDIPGNSCKGLAFEAREQVIRWAAVLQEVMPQIHVIVNDILGVPAFLVSVTPPTESKDDLGLD